MNARLPLQRFGVGWGPGGSGRCSPPGGPSVPRSPPVQLHDSKAERHLPKRASAFPTGPREPRGSAAALCATLNFFKFAI